MLSNGLSFFSAAQYRDSSFRVIQYVRTELEKISLEVFMQSGLASPPSHNHVTLP